MSKYGTGATPNAPRTITFSRRDGDADAVTCPVCDARVGSSERDMQAHAVAEGFTAHEVR